MATVFEIFIQTTDKEYAGQAAQCAFEELDRLEHELSRYIENSDISRINRAAPMTPVAVGLDAMACLKQCECLYHETGGAFDVTAGRVIDIFKKNQSRADRRILNGFIQPTGFEQVKLDESRFSVQRLDDAVLLDLGGFGKGYAIDRMAQVLREWDIETTLLHGGGSSVMALRAPRDLPGWPVTVSHPRTRGVIHSLSLSERAISGSGTRQQGHIIDPRTGMQADRHLASWVIDDTAARADALSTAFMILSGEEILDFSALHPSLQVLILTDEHDSILNIRWTNH